MNLDLLATATRNTIEFCFDKLNPRTVLYARRSAETAGLAVAGLQRSRMDEPDDKPVEKLDWRMLAPLLLAVAAFQGTIPLARIGTTYLALEEGISVAMITIISAGYALLPVFFAVAIGKANDRGNYGNMGIFGAVLMMSSVVGLLLLPASFHSLFLWSAGLGLAQTVMLNSTQMFVSRYATARARDTVLGYYMMCTSIGHIIGPLGMSLAVDSSLLHPGAEILQLCIGGGILLLVSVVVLRRFASTKPRDASAAPVTIASVFKAPNLRWVIICSSLCMSAGDLLLVFLPIVAVKLGISATALGTILSIRAGATLLVRFAFVPLINLLGRRKLMVSAMCASALGFAMLSLPLGFWGVTFAVALCGLGLGTAMPTALSLIFAISPPHAVGTITSVRMTASRLAQFLIPFPAGMAAAASGTGMVFVTLGLFISASAFMAWRRV